MASSSSNTTALYSPGAAFQSTVTNIKKVGKGIQVSGTITLVNGTITFQDPTTVLDPSIDLNIACALSWTDDHVSGSHFVERVYDVNSSVVCQAVMVDELGNQQNPTSYSNSKSGLGIVVKRTIHLQVRALLQSNTLVVSPGMSVGFTFKVGRAQPGNAIPMPSDLTVSVAACFLVRATPALDQFTTYDNQADPATYYGANLAIASTDLTALAAAYGSAETPLVLNGLHIDANNGGALTNEIEIPAGIMVLGQIYVDCSIATFTAAGTTFPQVSGTDIVMAGNNVATLATEPAAGTYFAWAGELFTNPSYGYASDYAGVEALIYTSGATQYLYALAANANNSAFSATYTLPNLTINGIVLGDVLFTGSSSVSTIANLLSLTGGTFVGRARTPLYDVMFNTLQCIEGSLMDSLNPLTISTAIATGASFAPKILPVADATVLINNSAVFQNIVTTASAVTAINSRVANFTHDYYPLDVAVSNVVFSNVSGGDYSTKYNLMEELAAQTSFPHYHDDCEFDRHTYEGRNAETFGIINSTIHKALVSYAGSDANSTITLRAREGGAVNVRTATLDDYNLLYCDGVVNFGEVDDARAAGTVVPFSCNGATLSIHKLVCDLDRDFSFAADAFIASTCSIGMLHIIGSATADLVFPSGFTVTNAYDRDGYLDQINIVNGSIGRFDLRSCSAATFKLDAVNSSVKLEFTPGTNVCELHDCSGTKTGKSVIDISGRKATASVTVDDLFAFDTNTQFILTDGSVIDYAVYGTALSASAEYPSLIIKYTKPTGVVTVSQVNVPATIAPAFANTTVINQTTRNITVKGKVGAAASPPSYSIRSAFLSNASSTVASGLKQLAFQTLWGL